MGSARNLAREVEFSHRNVPRAIPMVISFKMSHTVFQNLKKSGVRRSLKIGTRTHALDVERDILARGRNSGVV